MRLGGPAHGIVTKTIHKTLPGMVGVQRVDGYRVTNSGGDPGGGVGGRWRGLFDMKLTLSVRHNCLKLKMIT